MDEALEKALQAAMQESLALRNLREKFLLLAESGDKTALRHVAELEEREMNVRKKIKELHIHRLPLA